MYNVDLEKVREVSLTPRQWNGQGLLGCDVSFGFFNKLPLRSKDLQQLKKPQRIHSVFDKLTGDKTESHSEIQDAQRDDISITKKKSENSVQTLKH